MVVPKTLALSRPPKKSERTNSSAVWCRYWLMLTPIANLLMIIPPATPAMSPITARQTIIMAVATTRGTTRKRIGLIASASSASISSLTDMLPSSAAMLAPAKPVSTIAPISGPNSRNTAMAMMSATFGVAPYSFNTGAICSARIAPMQKTTKVTMGMLFTPTRTI